jgi:acyl-CoA thioesterase FadM
VSFVSRWPLLHEHRVTADDLDAHGIVRAEVVTRWLHGARDAYLAGLRTFDATGSVIDAPRVPAELALDRPTSVLVSAGTREVFPDSFLVALRLRSFGGERDVTLDTASVVHVEVSDIVRDELIAREHAAEHAN